MELISKSKFADLAGVSMPSISKALRIGRLETYNGTKKIDVSSPLAQAYLNNIPSQRAEVLSVVPTVQEQPEITPDIEKIVIEAGKAEKQLKIERAKKTKQERIKVELQNATRRGELIEQTAVETSIMMSYDRLLNNLRRMSGSFYDEMERKILMAGQSSPELKREWNNELEKMMDEAKNDVCDKLETIQNDQARG